MRILHVITSLQTGGAEKLVTEIVPKFRELGHIVDVALFDGTETAFKRKLKESGGIVYSFSEGGSVYSPKRLIQLHRLMKNYDIVHTHNTAPQFAAAIAGLFCSVVLVTTEHNTTNRRRDWKWYPRWLDKWMYRQYKHIICISDKAYDNLMSFLGKRFPLGKVQTIYNGVDIRKFRNAIPINRELVSITSQGKFVVVMVAGFRYQKDQDTLIKAISKLPMDKFELWLVGDGERRNSIESLIEELSLSNVKLLGIRNDVPEILHASDAVVLSSHFEGLSLSSIEGMCVGKPFIASDVDGLHEITEGAGLLFTEGDYKGLASILERLSSDKDYSIEIAKACFSRASLYDISKMVDAYNRIYISEK